MKPKLWLAGTLLLAMAAAARAQEPAAAPTSGGYVSREEYDRLKKEQDAMRQEIEDLKRALATRPAAPAQAAPGAPAAPAHPAPTTAAPAAPGPTNEDFEDLQNQVTTLKGQIDKARPGISNFTIHGDMDVGFTLQQHGGPSTFDAGFAPLILWQPIPKVLIEAGADIGIETDSDNNSDTTFDLTIANVSFLVNDNLAVGAGLFVVPFGVYHNHFDPPWINKFPDDPLPFGDGGIAPSSELGFFARGAVPWRSMKFTYDAYLTNGPNLDTTHADTVGSLNFDDFTDLNDNKAVGGRLGFLPFPNIEMGYSAMFAISSPQGMSDVDSFLQALDINYRQDCAFLRGTFDIRAEWVFSDTGRATYDPDGSLGFGPITFSNYRDGGYVQLCYRPTKVDDKFLRNVELVSRYDLLRSSLSAPGGDHEQRITLGVDYWITPAIVVKAAYQFDDKEVGPNQNAFLFQIGVGL